MLRETLERALRTHPAPRELLQAFTTLDRELGKLPAADQALLALARRDEMNLTKAAEALGIPYPTARTRQSKALDELHRRLVLAGVEGVPDPGVVPEVGLLEARAPRKGSGAG